MYSQDGTIIAELPPSKKVQRDIHLWLILLGDSVYSESHSVNTHKQAGKKHGRISTYSTTISQHLYRHEQDGMKKLGTLQEVKYQLRLNNTNTTKPSMSFLFGQTVQASEGFNKLCKASSSRRPLSSVCVPGRGVALHDDLLTQDPPSARTCHRLLPLESGGEGPVGMREFVCVCVLALAPRP